MRQIRRDGAEIVYFDTPAEFARAARPTVERSSYRDRHNSFAGVSPDAAANACINGDLECVSKAEALIESIHAAIETVKAEWLPAPCGAFPVVADYLAGHPLSMRRKVHVGSEAAPIRVYVDVVSSGNIGADRLVTRGIALLAMTMILTRSRPVELNVISPVGGPQSSIVVFPLPTQPLNVSVAAGVFTKGIARALTYPFQESRFRFNGGWYKGIPGSGDLERYTAALRKALDAGPEDMIIAAPHSVDGSMTDPVGFVQKMIDKSQGGDRE